MMTGKGSINHNSRKFHAENTVPEPDKTVTTTITVSVNKKGRFFLDMYNFKEGETIVITDIKYQGKSVIVN